MSLSRLPRPVVALLLALLSTFGAWVLVGFGTLKTLENCFYDIGITQRSARVPEEMIVLGIDARFMKGRHASLAPRDRLAKLLSIVSKGKPRVIALDVWLDSRLDDEPNGVDAQLRNSLLESQKRGVPVILSDLPPSESDFGAEAQNGQNSHSSVLPFFRDAALTGSVFFDLDDTAGAIRFHPPETSEPSLPLQMARFAGAPEFGPRLRSRGTPLDFCGPPGTIATQSAADFLESPYLAPILEGKLVFIGATYPRSRDYFATPYSFIGKKPMYGIEILAQATSSLARGAARRSSQTRIARFFDFSLVFLSALAVAFLALRGTASGLAAMICGLIVAVLMAFFSARDVSALWGFRFHGATPFLAALPLSASGATAWRAFVMGRELKMVRETFGAYVGSEVLAALGGKMPELGGETRPIAVLFCDIRGYSALAESMSHDPRALLNELNAHFAPLVEALQKRGAYVDNYVGDLVMALFGAPFSSGSFEGDVRAATLAALDFVRIVEERNALRRQSGQFPIEVGIGVHCGEAVVGNMGSKNSEKGGKIHYTAIGDVVNVASRVESATRAQNVALLVTRAVVETCGSSSDLPPWFSLGEITVKGRAAPVEVFRVANADVEILK